MYIIRTITDKLDKAKALAKVLVISHAAVSVHIHKCKSVYAWKGEIEEAEEYEIEIICSSLNTIKTIEQYHSYELPEILVNKIDASRGMEDYCNKWCAS